MKTNHSFPTHLLCLSLIALFALADNAGAAALIKANNTTALNLSGSYTAGGPPTIADTVTWNSTVAGANTVAIGGNLSMLGIIVSNPGGAVVVTEASGNVLTLGSSGIDMSGASQNLTLFNSAVAGDIAISANQTWNVASGRTLTLFPNANTLNQRLTGSGNIEVTGGGIVRLLVGDAGSTTFTAGNGNDTYTGNWTITSGSVRGLRNGTHAWGQGSITLNGGTIGQEQGSWTWANNISLNTSTTSTVDDFNTSGTRTLKLQGIISGAGNLTFAETGAGSHAADGGYILTGANTMSGTVTINSPALVRVGGVPGNDITTGVGSSGTLGTAAVVNNSTLTLSRDNTWTFANTVSGTGILRIGLATGSATHIATVSGNNSHSGGTTLQSAVTLNVGHANALGTGTFTIAGNGIFDNTTGGPVTVANAFTLSGGSPTFTGSSDMTINGAVTLSGANRTVTVTAGTLTLGGAVSGAFNLTKQGAGTLTLSGASTSYANSITVGTATLKLGSADALGTTAAGTSVSSGGALDLNGQTIGAEALTLNGTGVSSSGALINNSGTAASLSGAITLGTASSVGGSGNTTLSGVISGAALGLTKFGGGTVTLNNAETYSGNTTISAGTLALGASGTIASTPTITVTSGGVFDVASSSFALGGSQTLIAGRTSGFATDVNGTLASAGIINPAANGTKGTLTVAGGLTLSGGTLNLDLTGGNTTVGGGVNDLISASGALNLSGSTTINVTWTGSPVTGTYEIIGCASLGSGTGANLVKGTGLTDGPRITFTLDTTTTPGTVYLVVAGGPASLTWVGDGGSNPWDIGTTADWTNNATLVADNYYDLDTVTFDDSSANGAVGLGVTVSPGSVTVNNSSTAYSLTGAGKISGTGGLTKSGTTTLTVGTANDYSGGTTISAGTVVVPSGGALGSGAVVDNGTLQWDNSSALTFNNAVSGSGAVTKTSGGTLTMGGAGTYAGNTTISAGTLKLGAANLIPDGATKGNVSLTGTLDLNANSETINGLSGSGTVDNSVVGTPTLTVGGNDQTSSFGGVIQNTAGTVALTKTGTGAVTLSGANTYGGATTISGGTLQLGNAAALGTTALGTTVSSGAALDLNGQAIGAEAVTVNGTGISSGGALINSSGTAASLSGAITLGSASSIGGSGNTTLSGNITSTSGLTKTGAGTVTLGGVNTTWTAGTFTLDGGGVTLTESRALAGTSAANGRATTIKSGTLDLAYSGTANQWTTSLVSGKSALRLGNLTMGGSAGATSALTASGSPDIGFGVLGGFTTTFTYDAANNGGTATIAARWISAGTTLEGTSVLDIGDSSATTVEVDFTGAINATGQTDGLNFRLRKTGAGALRISTANFLPKVTVTAGKLIVNHANALGASRIGDGGSANLVTVDGGTLDLNGFNPSVGGLADGGVTTGVIQNDGGSAATLTIGASGANTTYGGLIQNGSSTVALAKTGAGELTFSGANTYSGGTTVGAGMIRVSTSDSALGAGAITFSGNSTLAIASGGGARTLANNISINSGVTAGFDAGFANLTLGGVISGAGHLATASVVGTTELTGANTYTGDTTVVGGTTLKLGASGSIGSSPNITVNSAGTFNVSSVSGGFTLGAAQTLKGNGTVVGPITVLGTIAPGTSIGTLTLGGGATLSGTVLAEIATGPSADRIDFTGSSTLGGTLTVTQTGGLANGEVFNLFDYTGGAPSGTFGTVSLPGGAGHWNTTDLYVGGTITFTNASPSAPAIGLSVGRGESVTFTFAGSKHSITPDVDGDAITVTGTGGTPTLGTASSTAGSVTYTSTGASGSDSFTYTVSDGLGGTAVGTVTVQVLPLGNGANTTGFTYVYPTATLYALGIPGTNYVMQITTNVAPPVIWSDVSGAGATATAATNGSMTLIDVNATNGSAFYRTRYLP